MSGLLTFDRANAYWWRKPLVRLGNQATTAELAVLASELRPNERGVWLNSRPKASGVVELLPKQTMKGSSFQTRREALPLFVVAGLEAIYNQAQVNRGCPDLVIWRTDREQFRLVEVKCPHWDRPSSDQQRFIDAATKQGIETRVVEWEFGERAA